MLYDSKLYMEQSNKLQLVHPLTTHFCKRG